MNVNALVAEAQRDGFVVLRNHFSAATLALWNQALQPLLARQIARDGHGPNRGSCRYYVTLPFQGLWADPALFDDDLILAVVEGLVGHDAVMVQLASDTPVRGSEYQEIHRDAPPLFPELDTETPAFQLAVNFPLVAVTKENGPVEIARGTHRMTKSRAMAEVDSGRIPLEPVLMQLGDVMVRDVRGLHRGTPNHTDTPRPMVVIGYSRKWLFRPEVQIVVPRAVGAQLSTRAQHMLRHSPIVDALSEDAAPEVYQAFAY